MCDRTRQEVSLPRCQVSRNFARGGPTHLLTIMVFYLIPTHPSPSGTILRIKQAICDRRITAVLDLLQAPGADRSLWAVIFCSKIASAAVGFLLHHHVSRDHLGAAFASMAPGELLPQLLVHLGLFQVMYCQSPQVWEATSRLLMQAIEDWMDAMIRERILVRRVDPATHAIYWERDHNTEVRWRNNPDSLLEWVDTTLFSTANLDLRNVSEERRVSQIFASVTHLTRLGLILIKRINGLERVHAHWLTSYMYDYHRVRASTRFLTCWGTWMRSQRMPSNRHQAKFASYLSWTVFSNTILTAMQTRPPPLAQGQALGLPVMLLVLVTGLRSIAIITTTIPPPMRLLMRVLRTILPTGLVIRRGLPSTTRGWSCP